MAVSTGKPENELAKLRELYENAGQEHVFQFIDKLDDSHKTELIAQLANTNVTELGSLHRSAVEAKEASTKACAEHLEPLKQIAKISLSSQEDKNRWEQIGFEKIKEGKLAALVLAGGQGTRLSATDPKGMYSVDLLSNQTLYEIQARRLKKLQDLTAQRFGIAPPQIRWYIMTSPATDSQTRNIFASKNYFDLDKNQVVIFSQGILPCLTPEGRIIMENSHKMATAPNGNGGLYSSLQSSGTLQDMINNGVEYVFQYCVDNILIKMVDPIFAGYLYEQDSDCACKVVSKSSPDEAVGVVCKIDGKFGVVEYSEIDQESKTKRNESGELVFNAAHICINTFRIDFLEKAAKEYAKELPYHIASKVIPCVDQTGNTCKPEKPNGWKLEQFIFDVFPYAKKLVAFEIERSDEFAPLKNAPGTLKDSPETVRESLFSLHKNFIERSGGIIVKGEKNNNYVSADLNCLAIEIAPEISYAGEGLEFVKGKTFTTPFYLDKF